MGCGGTRAEPGDLPVDDYMRRFSPCPDPFHDQPAPTPSEPLSGSGEEKPCPDAEVCQTCDCGSGEERWTVCVNSDHRNDGDLHRGVCPDCAEPLVEVVPASLAARYKADAEEARTEAAQWEGSFRGMVGVEKDLKANLRAAEQARDEAHALLNKALPFIPEPHPRRDSESGPCLRDRILAALSTPPTEETSDGE